MILNCDLGERGVDHAVDRALMAWIGLANLACGGHAGDAESVAVFHERARQQGVAVSAHLSYPDRAHFGRRSLTLSRPALAAALEDQWRNIPEVDRVKFHGALYLDSCRDAALAAWLAAWLRDHGVRQVICPASSELARASEAAALQVLAEAFLERRYQPGPSGVPELVPRRHPLASIPVLSEALTQAEDLVTRGGVTCVDGSFHPLRAETLCIHSDAPIALELARSVSHFLTETE